MTTDRERLVDAILHQFGGPDIDQDGNEESVDSAAIRIMREQRDLIANILTEWEKSARRACSAELNEHYGSCDAANCDCVYEINKARHRARTLTTRYVLQPGRRADRP